MSPFLDSLVLGPPLFAFYPLALRSYRPLSPCVAPGPSFAPPATTRSPVRTVRDYKQNLGYPGLVPSLKVSPFNRMVSSDSGIRDQEA